MFGSPALGVAGSRPETEAFLTLSPASLSVLLWGLPQPCIPVNSCPFPLTTLGALGVKAGAGFQPRASLAPECCVTRSRLLALRHTGREGDFGVGPWGSDESPEYTVPTLGWAQVSRVGVPFYRGKN